MAKLNKKLYEMNVDDFHKYIAGANPYMEGEFQIYRPDKDDFIALENDSEFYDLCKHFATIDELLLGIFKRDKNVAFEYGTNVFHRLLDMQKLLPKNERIESEESWMEATKSSIRPVYEGQYKNLNEKFKNLAYVENPALEEWMKKETKKVTKISRTDKENLMVVSQFGNKCNNSIDLEIKFWNRIGLEAMIDMWKYTKITYSLHPTLALDFINQDKLILPKSVTEKCPFSVFYLDFSNIKDIFPFQTMLTMEGVLVRLLKDDTDAMIDLIFHCKRGKDENFIFEDAYRFDENGELLFNRQIPFTERENTFCHVDLESFKKEFKDGKQKNDIAKIMFKMAELREKIEETSKMVYHISDNFLNIAGQKNEEKSANDYILREVSRMYRNVLYPDYYGNYNPISDNGFSLEDYYANESQRLAKKQANEPEPEINLLIDGQNESTRFAWQWECYARITLCTIFYLSCNAGRIYPTKPKTNYVYKERKDATSTERKTLGENLAHLHLSQSNYDTDTVTVYTGTGKSRKLTKVRFTRGHFHYYYVGSRKKGTYRKEEEPHYIEPYVSKPEGEIKESKIKVSD